ncbi:MAG: class II fumarate hydratase [Phycisphaerales bacterium]|nr:class II fumarate hydratase [Phycisphaerales bacterium]
MSNTTHPAVRIEKDSIGPLEVPMDAYYGVQTLRAMRNFPVSGQPMPPAFLKSHARLKKAAAMVNHELGLLDATRATAIAQAADEIIAGKLADQLPVDIYQTGSGTSTNMNLNEVLASRANELLGGKRGDKSPVHPNDHVNMGQSSNDTIPTSLHVAALEEITRQLRPALTKLEMSLREKSRETWNVIKTGRTHLQDATPIRLGQEFLGYAGQVQRSGRRLDAAEKELAEVALGGTAVGTGINAHPKFSPRVCQLLSQWLEVQIVESDNHFQAQATLDGACFASGVLKTIAVSLTKIANDVRWMACGPRAGFAEIEIPAVQPGSSIMPGKVNPVIAESLLMVCQRVIGNDATVTAAASSGNFELIVAMPVVAAALLESITLLARASENFALQCVDGIVATTRGPALVESGLMLATALAPVVGYEKAAALAKEAAKTGKTIREMAAATTNLSPQQLDELLNPAAMVEPSDKILPTSG